MEHRGILSQLVGLLIYLLSSILGRRELKAETLLPLGKFDPGLQVPKIGLDLGSINSGSQLADQRGHHSLLMEETKVDPSQMFLLAADQTTRVKPGTSFAVRLAGSPFNLAQSSWTAHKISVGRFELA